MLGWFKKLFGGKKDESALKGGMCPNRSCGKPVAAGLSKCPACGTVMPAKA